MKKSISLLLCFVLVIGLLASPALAWVEQGDDTLPYTMYFVDGNKQVFLAYHTDSDTVLPEFFDIYMGGPEGKVLDYWEVLADYTIDSDAYVTNYDTGAWIRAGKAGDTYTLTADVVIRPVFKDAPTPYYPSGETSTPAPAKTRTPGPTSFLDVNEGDWFYDAVMWASAQGLMVGYGNGYFGPNDPLNRAGFTQVLFNLAYGEAGAITTKFEDVKADDWFAVAVSWGVEKGVINGMTETTFGPEIGMTREMSVVMLYRYAKSAGIDVSVKGDLGAFTDADSISDYAVEAFEWAVGIGMIKGETSTTLNPQGTTTRAQFATMLQRFPAK